MHPTALRLLPLLAAGGMVRAASLAWAAETVPPDVELPGTQPGDVSGVGDSEQWGAQFPPYVADGVLQRMEGDGAICDDSP